MNRKSIFTALFLSAFICISDRILLLLLITLTPLAFAQQAPASIARQLYSFSPMAQIYLKHLGLSDKNSNGVIENGAGEGYEAFTAKYGNADVGFYANRVLCGANNGKLEENEIVNHYYLNIRFAPAFLAETTAIENEVKAYSYANNIPLVWLDDQQGTVMNAVNSVLGEGWNEKKVSENEAVQMFNRAMGGLGIIGRQGEPRKNGGYYTLPEFINSGAGYCVEIAQFGFWFFSQLKINAVTAQTAVTSSILHEIVKLKSGRLVDYSGSGKKYNTPNDSWQITNPLQEIGLYYEVKGEALTSHTMREQAMVYDKYNIDNYYSVMVYYLYMNNDNDADILSNLGEFFLQHNDIEKILKVNYKMSSFLKGQVKTLLIMLLICYKVTDNIDDNNRIAALLQKHYDKDAEVKRYLNNHKLIRRAGT